MNLLSRIAVVGLCPFLMLAATSQSATAQSSVAIVDMGQVFKSHPRFAQSLEQLKAEAEQFKAKSLQLRDEMVNKSEQLKMYTPGSEEFMQAESALAQELAKLEVQQRDQMRKMMLREARLHFETYKEIKQLVGAFCEQRGIRLVLRHSDTDLDPDNPNSLMQEVNRNVVYYQPGRDITQAIIQQLNGSASAGNAVNN